MNKYIFVLTILSLFSCSPNDPVSSCSLNNYNGKLYVGEIMLCNAMPGQQKDFPGKALMIISDSLLTFKVESLDPNINFTYNVIVKDECNQPENNIFIHVLHSTLDNSIVGEIGGDGTSLFLDLIVDPCFDTSIFSGLIK